MTLEDLAITLKRIEEQVNTVSRGIYGDAKNGVKGLIKTDMEQHERIKKLEDFKKKAMWVTGGAIVVFELIFHLR